MLETLRCYGRGRRSTSDGRSSMPNRSLRAHGATCTTCGTPRCAYGHRDFRGSVAMGEPKYLLSNEGKETAARGI
jgi:hypothetical protein